MNLSEYYKAFVASLGDEHLGPHLPRDIAACVAAGHAVALPIEQLRQFLSRRAEINSVTVALTGELVSPETIEKILSARSAGCIYPREVLAHAFSKEQVKEKFHGAAFGVGAQQCIQPDGPASGGSAS